MRKIALLAALTVAGQPGAYENRIAGYTSYHQGVLSSIIPINTVTDYQDPNQNLCNNPMRNVDNWNLSFGFKSNHSGGANFCLCDGSVRFLSQTIDHKLYNQLGCKNDGQPASPP